VSDSDSDQFRRTKVTVESQQNRKTKVKTRLCQKGESKKMDPSNRKRKFGVGRTKTKP
jgi:hypothetical protein